MPTTCVAVFKLSQQLWVAQPAALLRRTLASRSGGTIPEPAAAFSFVALPHCQLDLSVPCRGCQAMVNKSCSHTKLRLCPTKNFCFKAHVVKTNQQNLSGHSKRCVQNRLQKPNFEKLRDPSHFLGPNYVNPKRPFPATKRAFEVKKVGPMYRRPDMKE